MPRISSPWGNIFCKFGKEAAVCLDKTIIYTRDAGGNVTQKKVESWLRDFLANMTSELPMDNGISDKIYEAGEANTNEANTNNSVLNKMKAGGGENVRQ